MLDRRFIRDNPDAVKAAVRAKGIDLDVDELLQADKTVRNLTHELDDAQALRKSSAKQFANADEARRAELRAEHEKLESRLRQLRDEEGTADRPFEVHVISLDAFTVDGVRRLEEQGVTDVIVGFRWPYVVGPDTEVLQSKLDNLRRFADDVIGALRS